MKISVIVAMAANRVIGHENRLPWHLPADLKHFKATTLGKPVVMGRRTWESIGRPLPGRTNIVITRDTAYTAEGCVVVHSLDEAIRAAGEAAEVMIIGGAGLYRQALSLADTLYLTLIHGEFAGDTHFPQWRQDEWRETGRIDHEPDENNSHAYSFITLERVAG
jgi:dihydrofolate reductase